MPNPDKIYHVSHTQLSIARYYGGITFNGDFYTYDAAEDSLTRRPTPAKKPRVKRKPRAEITVTELP